MSPHAGSDRRGTVLLLAASPAAAAPPDLERVTVAKLQAKMTAGGLTGVELANAYLERIAALNNRGPGLNAVRLVNPDVTISAVDRGERAAAHRPGRHDRRLHALDRHALACPA